MIGWRTGNQGPCIGIVARSIDEVCGLHKKTTIDGPHLLYGMRWLFDLKNPQILLLGLQEFQSFGLICGRHDDFGENRTDVLGHFQRHRRISCNDAAVGAHRITCMGFAMSLRNGFT